MQIAIVTAPTAFLYENSTGSRISDELLSGWVVSIQAEQHCRLKVVTHYGYTGWLDASAACRAAAGQWECWDTWPWHGWDGRRDKECLELEACKHVRQAILCRASIDLLAEPTVQARILTTLFMGSSVQLLEPPKDGWQKIRAADASCGYVPSISLLRPECLEQFPVKGQQAQMRLRYAILGYAMSYFGAPYRWGGKTYAGIDCSGLAFMSYYMCGILIYRDAAIKEGYPVREIPLSQIQPADLLYFPGHVALYLGEGKYIHSTGNPASFGCTINSLDPKDPDYRKDLALSLDAAGSIFP